MAIRTVSSEEIATNLKRIRKEKKINQKQLAKLLDKSERTIQNYEAGEIDFTMSTLKDIAIALDIDFRELLATPDNEDGMHVGVNMSKSPMNKFTLETFADIVNVLFKIQETYDLSMKFDISKPPEDKEWKSTISVDGKGNSKYDADFCLFLENWKHKMDLLYSERMSIEKYWEWQLETMAYYSNSLLTPATERPDLEEFTTELGNQAYRWKNPMKRN